MATTTEDEIQSFVDSDYPRVVAAVGLITGDHALAEDGVQDALVKYWQRVDDEPVRSLAAWVTVVASNTVRSAQRRRGAEERATDRLVSGQNGLAHPPTGDALDLERGLQGLPDRQREVAVLFYYFDWPVASIAVALGVSEGTVKTSLSRARQALARALGDEEATSDD